MSFYKYMKRAGYNNQSTSAYGVPTMVRTLCQVLGTV